MSGNWKMHLDHLEAIRAVAELGMRLEGATSAAVDVSVHPPFTALRSVQTVLEDRAIAVSLGAQDCHWEDSGAYTGEVSPPMLARLGVTYVIVGHSERRRLFGETDEQVAAKLRAVQRHEMTPVVCVGETEDERADGLTLERLVHQVKAAFEGLGPEAAVRTVVAYEPIWAIGTGQTATTDDAEEACAHIRGVLAEVVGEEPSSRIRIQYGGSVKPDNAGELMTAQDVDGLLVGGASLDPTSFTAIVRAAAAACSATPGSVTGSITP